GSRHGSRCLTRHQRLKCKSGKQVGLRYLSFDDGGPHRQHRLACKEWGSVGNREQISAEAEIAQIIEKRRRHALELRKTAQVADLVRTEADIEQVIYALIDTGGDNEVPILRQTPDGKFENCFLIGLSGFKIAGRHGEFVKIGEETVQVSDSVVRACASLPFF